MKVAFENTRWQHATLSVLEYGIDQAGGEDAGQQRADRAADSVYAKGIQRIVITQASFYHRANRVAADAGDQAYDQRRHRSDESGRGRDRHQSGHAAGDGSQHTGLAIANPFRAGPTDSSSCSGEVR